MLESLVEKKIAAEKDEVRDIELITKDVILKKNLSDFTRNYIVNDVTQTADTSELLQKIEKANKLYFNYAIRPKWTLLVFLFNDFESRPPSEILKKLNLFPFYNYYADAVRNFITDNFQIFVTKSEVTAIIDSTNKIIYEKLSTEIGSTKIKNFFLQIFKFKYGDEPNWSLESTIPFSLVRIFLEDKSFGDLLNKFKATGAFSDSTEISLINIVKVLTDKYSVPAREQTPPNLTGPAKLPEEKKPVEPTKPVEEKKSVVQTPVKEKERKVIYDKSKEEVKKSQEAVTERKIYSDQLIKASEERTSKEVKEKKNEAGSRSSLKILFDEKQLDRISSKIYNKSLISMDKSFEKLNHYKTWFEASNHLKEIFKNNRVDIYNKDVITFVDMVSEFYKDRE